MVGSDRCSVSSHYKLVPEPHYEPFTVFTRAAGSRSCLRSNYRAVSADGGAKCETRHYKGVLTAAPKLDLNCSKMSRVLDHFLSATDVTNSCRKKTLQPVGPPVGAAPPEGLLGTCLDV